MNKPARMKWIPLSVLFLACAYAQSQEPPNSTSASSAPRWVEVDADTASSLVVEKAPINYPDAARTAGLEGTVVLKVATTYSGDVEEVTVLSGDPALAQAAVDAVKKWKYKPYVSEGSPAGIKTQVTINFHLKAHAQPSVLPLGVFRDNAYSNDYLGIYYPLSRDWVLETSLTRSNLASEGKGQGTYVLLSAIHIPQNTTLLTADSAIVVLALGRTGMPAPDDCKRYLESAADGVHSRKEAQLKGGLTQFSIAGHDFYRGDFEFRHGTDHGALLCTAVKDYLLQWDIRDWSKRAIETAVSTLDSMTPMPATPQTPDTLVELSKVPPTGKSLSRSFDWIEDQRCPTCLSPGGPECSHSGLCTVESSHQQKWRR